MSWRAIGILGGMGPLASADFLARLVAGAAAAGDSGHPRILLDSNPAVPDRNAAFRGSGPSPAPALAAMAEGLVAQGAEVLAMPCNAAHIWADAVRETPGAQFIDMVAATVAELRRMAPVKVGLIAVEAARQSGLYRRPLEQAGIVVEEADGAATARLVARVKGGDTGDEAQAEASALARTLAAAGAEAILMACTEIPLVLHPGRSPVPLVDPTALLVAATLAAARPGHGPCLTAAAAAPTSNPP